MRITRLLGAVALASVLAAPSVGGTSLEWPSSGVGLSTDATELHARELVEDGAGGVFAVAGRSGEAYGEAQLRAQRLDASGARLWGDSGAAVTSAVGDPYDAAVIGDGAGGVFVGWGDEVSPQPGTFVQRIDGSGARPWIASAPDGVKLPGVDSPTSPAMLRHRDGGVVAIWSPDITEIRAQRIGLDGATKWGTNGTILCSKVDGRRYPPRAVADGSGGAFVCWLDTRGRPQWPEPKAAYVQRMDAGGAVAAGWPADGLAVCTDYSRQRNVHVVPDGQGGAIVVWQDDRGGDGYMDEYGDEEAMTIWGQRFSAAGQRLWDPAAGLRLHDGQTRALDYWRGSGLVVSAGGAGGFLLVWEEYVRFTSDAVMKAQLFDADGAPVLAVPVGVNDVPNGNRDWSGSPDGSGGAFVVWEDQSDSGGWVTVRGQHLGADGSPLWGTGGGPLEIRSPGGSVYQPLATPDGAGGAFVAWDQYVGGGKSSARAQHIVGTGAATLVCGFLQPTAVTRRIDPKRDWRNSLTWTGLLDGGPSPVSLASAVHVGIGGLDFPLPVPTAQRGGRFVTSKGPVEVTLVPRAGGGSRCAVTIVLKGADVASIGADAPLTVQFRCGIVDRTSTCALRKGRYTLASGGVADGATIPLSFKATFAATAKASFTAKFAVPPGPPSEPIPDVRFAFGPTYDVTIPGASFHRKGSIWRSAGTGGRPTVVLDAAKGVVTVTGGRSAVGSFPLGAQAVRIVFGPGEPAMIDVCMVRKGGTLVW